MLQYSFDPSYAQSMSSPCTLLLSSCPHCPTTSDLPLNSAQAYCPSLRTTRLRVRLIVSTHKLKTTNRFLLLLRTNKQHHEESQTTSRSTHTFFLFPFSSFEFVFKTSSWSNFKLTVSFFFFKVLSCSKESGFFENSVGSNF